MTKRYCIRGADIWNADDASYTQKNLYIQDGRIVSDLPHGALVLDLEGYRIFPALINAHDHLELNHYPRSKFRNIYANAHDWGEDVNMRLDDEPYRQLQIYPIWERVFIGGLKNLLSGALTVIQHGTSYRELYKKQYPVNVLQNYGWAHSLHFSTEEQMIHSYQNTPKHVPWFVHLAEGTDEIATSEYWKLKELGCIGKNTVLIHGVGLDDEALTDAKDHIRGLVWCGTTNQYLLGKMANIQSWVNHDISVAIGSDSRLTADGDLWNEIHALSEMLSIPLENTMNISLRSTEWLFGRKHDLSVGHIADLIITKDNINTRADIALIVKNGVAQIGDVDLMQRFHTKSIDCKLDGQNKRIATQLAKQIHKSSLKERGLHIEPINKRWFRLW